MSSRSDLWRPFTPRLAIAGQPQAQWPVLGTVSISDRSQGQYLWLPDEELCIYDFLIQFASAGVSIPTAGTLLVELPARAKRQLSQRFQPVGNAALGGSFNQGDRCLGSAYVSRFVQANGIEVYPSIADIPPLGEDMDRWAQFFCPWQRDNGTATIASGTTSIAVAFNFTMQNTPQLGELNVLQSTQPANNVLDAGFWITGLSTAGFTINIRANPGVGGVSFGWNVRMDRCVWVDTVSPWLWGSSGDGIYGKFVYRTAQPPAGY